MPVVVVANPKGGVGKSTLATNIAGYFASKGHAVMLGDADRQQSSPPSLGLPPPPPLAGPAPAGRTSHHYLGSQRRPDRQAAQRHDACRTGHPWRPARLALQ